MGKLAVLELNGKFEQQALQAKLKIGAEGKAPVYRSVPVDRAPG